MRTVAMVKRSLAMMCERALSRRTQGEMLAQKQMVQQYVADSFIQLEQFRLLVLYTAWLIDKGRKKDARTYIAAVKVAMADVLHDVVHWDEQPAPVRDLTGPVAGVLHRLP